MSRLELNGSVWAMLEWGWVVQPKQITNNTLIIQTITSTLQCQHHNADNSNIIKNYTITQYRKYTLIKAYKHYINKPLQPLT